MGYERITPHLSLLIYRNRHIISHLTNVTFVLDNIKINKSEQ
jgi:hypothetical protein